MTKRYLFTPFKGSIRFALLFALISTVQPTPGICAVSEDEVAELRAMVMALRGEVETLKAQLAEKEEKRDVQLPPKPEKDSPVRQPLEKPAVAGVSSKYGLSFYGYIKLDAFYDSALTSHQEIPFWAASDTGNSNGEFDMTAKETRLGMNFDGPEISGGKLTGKIELDFYGNINTPSSMGSNHAFQLRSRHAYLNWDFDDWSILAGQTWEPYMISIPNTLNFTYYGFLGNLGLRKTQLRLTRKIDLGNKSGLELIGAILEPVGGVTGGDIDGDSQDDAADSEMPLFSGKVLYKVPLLTDKPATFGISAIYGEEDIEIPTVGDPKTYQIWAVSAGVTLPLTDSLTWTTSVFRGSNLDSVWGNIGQGINLSRQTEIEGMGGWTQLHWDATDKLSFNLGYSVDNPHDDDLNTGARTRNESILLNTYYKFSPALTLGLEYFRLETGYKGLEDVENHRIHSSLIYRF